MKNITSYLASLLFCGVILLSCGKKNPVPEGLVVETGTSFGECVKNCFQVMTFNSLSKNLEFEIKNNPTAGENATQRFQESFSETEYNEILNSIDFDVFKGLQKFYGCPDCADGGAEFIRLSDNMETGESYLVTFEYGKSVKGIEKLITLLRKKREELSAKYINQ